MSKWLTASERATINADPKIPTYRHRSSNDREKYPSRIETGPIEGTAAPERKYGGDAIIGIATMHKSNAVPVTDAAAATDIANMRRGG